MQNPLKLIMSLHTSIYHILMDTSEQVKIVQQDDGLLLVKSAVKKALWEMIQPFDVPD